MEGTTPGDAVEAGLRALRRRDLSIRELDRRLAERGFSEHARGEALATLSRTGILDDGRFAEARARSLAERGAGDALIRHALAAAGVAPEIVEDAVAALSPEGERARLHVARRGTGAKTARYLRGKGFSEDVVAGVVAAAADDELG